VTVHGIHYSGGLVAAGGDDPASITAESGEKHGVRVFMEGELKFARLRVPNPNDMVLTTGDNTQTVRAETGTKNLLRMIQSKDFAAITGPPNAGRFVSAGGNDGIAIRAVGASVQTITLSKWRRDRLASIRVEYLRFAQPLNRQKVPAIRTESCHLNLFGSAPQLHKLWALTQNATEPEAM
jgi:hypothetical protein